jgi:hypothetical protein
MTLAGFGTASDRSMDLIVVMRIIVILISVPNDVLKSMKQSLEATSVICSTAVVMTTEDGAVLEVMPLFVILASKCWCPPALIAVSPCRIVVMIVSVSVTRLSGLF